MLYFLSLSTLAHIRAKGGRQCACIPAWSIYPSTHPTADAACSRTKQLLRQRPELAGPHSLIPSPPPTFPSPWHDQQVSCRSGR